MGFTGGGKKDPTQGSEDGGCRGGGLLIGKCGELPSLNQGKANGEGNRGGARVGTSLPGRGHQRMETHGVGKKRRKHVTSTP